METSGRIPPDKEEKTDEAEGQTGEAGEEDPSRKKKKK